VAPDVREALFDSALAFMSKEELSYVMNLPRFTNSVDGGSVLDVYEWRRPQDPGIEQWVLMPPDLAGVYKIVLAENVAGANMLQPTTDQDGAYAVANNWTADRISEVLLGNPGNPVSLTPGELPEILGFLALELVIPANLEKVPIDQIIDIRERYKAEFFAFGRDVDQAAASMADLSSIRDEATLEDYLRQVVTVRFVEPMADLRKRIRSITGDAATMSINVKTQLPAGAALAGGAWLTGHPLLAGTSAAAIGLMAIHRGARRQREDVRKSSPAPSFLLHTQDYLQPRNLLDRTIHQLTPIVRTKH